MAISMIGKHSCAFSAASVARPFRPFNRTLVVRAEHINPSIAKDNPKVVDSFKASELPKKAVFCRCWRSAKFPYCDGAHAAHNKETGDNVGPLIVDNDDKQ